MAEGATALTPEAFAPALARVVPASAAGLVLAVSGGPDSMALLWLVAALRASLPPVVVGTVDHGLRPGSADDAARVADWAVRCGLPCRTLHWIGDKPRHGIQSAARAARYRLLFELCAEAGADHLLTAHTVDDQAETVLFRLLRGSGIAGLAAMRPAAQRAGLTVARPLLGTPKARLLETCRQAGIAIHHDPANVDPRFSRARLRRIMPLLEAEGLDAAGMARLANRLARADAALVEAADVAYSACSGPVQQGAIKLDGAQFSALPTEIAIRVLGRAVGAAGGSADRLDRLENLTMRVLDALRSGQPLRATLGGVLADTADGVVRLRRESARRRGVGTRTPTPTAEAVAPFPWQG